MPLAAFFAPQSSFLKVLLPALCKGRQVWIHPRLKRWEDSEDSQGDLDVLRTLPLAKLAASRRMVGGASSTSTTVPAHDAGNAGRRVRSAMRSISSVNSRFWPV